eukprot:SAG11_NODE_26563_length_343_cov_1.266393_1_plen_37_part_01
MPERGRLTLTYFSSERSIVPELREVRRPPQRRPPFLR